jgi:hypothetical protein
MNPVFGLTQPVDQKSEPGHDHPLSDIGIEMLLNDWKKVAKQ